MFTLVFVFTSTHTRNTRNSRYWGFWTANPKPSARAPADSPCAGKSCGAGFGWSLDGLNWTALPTPGPFSQFGLAPEVGGVAQLGGETWMLHTNLFQSPSPDGAWAPAAKNYNFFGQEGWSRFPRIWGYPYTGDKDLMLVTHQQCNFWRSYYVGLVKRAMIGPRDGVLRVVWWAANDVLRGAALQPRPLIANTSNSSSAPTGCGGTSESSPSSCSVTECSGVACMSSGLWLEGTIGTQNQPATGLWLQTISGGGFAFTVSTLDDGRNLTFALGAAPSAADVNGSWVTRTQAAGGPLRIDRAISSVRNTTTNSSSSSVGVDRWVPPPTRWRAVARNAWSGEGMVEFYVGCDEVQQKQQRAGEEGEGDVEPVLVMSLPFTLGSGLTGAWDTVGGATVTAVHRLSLPES
jgi:hypothetical protein